jgi:hypothetical protein
MDVPCPSNSTLAGVHNSPVARLHIELENNRLISIAPLGPLAIGAQVAKNFVLGGGVTKMFRRFVRSFEVDRRYGEDLCGIVYKDGDKEDLNSTQYQEAYSTAIQNPQTPSDQVLNDKARLREEARLRQILVARLQEEEEYERLTMYAQDLRFEKDITKN